MQECNKYCSFQLEVQETFYFTTPPTITGISFQLTSIMMRVITILTFSWSDLVLPTWFMGDCPPPCERFKDLCKRGVTQFHVLDPLCVSSMILVSQCNSTTKSVCHLNTCVFSASWELACPLLQKKNKNTFNGIFCSM